MVDLSRMYLLILILVVSNSPKPKAFQIFVLISQKNWTNFNQTWHKSSVGEWESSLLDHLSDSGRYVVRIGAYIAIHVI